jgi:cytochrome c-type biogenesis protein
VIVIVMGLVFIGQVTVLQRTIKPAWQPATGLAGAPLLGAVFAIGWTPCIGPTLVAVTSLASYQGDPGRAAIIGAFYCLGLGIPFLLVALGLGWVSGSVAWVKKHIRVINIIGGSLLVLIGVLMVTGLWGLAMSELGVLISGFLPAL